MCKFLFEKNEPYELKFNYVGVIFYRIVVFGFFVLALFGCAREEEVKASDYEFVFRLAEAHPIDHPTTLADYEFARRVEEETDGRIKIIVYPNQELGEERNAIEQVQFGAIDFTRVSIAPLSEIVDALKVLYLPYLYVDGNHMWRVLDSQIGDYFLDTVEEAGFIGLGWFDAGARSFYNSVRPIEGIEDLKGLNIRVMESSLMLEMVQMLGANGIRLPYGEVYSALQLESIDGAENNYVSFETSSHYEIAKYYSIDEHVRVPEMLIGSKKALDQIGEEDWLIIKRVAKEIEAYQRSLWLEKDEQSKAFLIEKGVIINSIEDRSEFETAVKSIYDEYLEEYGEILRQIGDLEDN